MVIFTDASHHGGLMTSFNLLFNRRLSHVVLYPWGMDWFEKGFWHIGDCYGDDAHQPAKQFLTGSLPKDGTETISIKNTTTFDEFLENHIDLIIVTHYSNIDSFEELKNRYHPQAKIIHQFGNSWEPHPLTRNLMLSTEPMDIPSNINWISYHQNIDEAVYGHYSRSSSGTNRLISSFVNALPINSIFQQDWKDFLEFETIMNDYTLKSYGGGCRDGSLSQNDVAKEMTESDWIIQFKHDGDGLAIRSTVVLLVGHHLSSKVLNTGENWVEDC